MHSAQAMGAAIDDSLLFQGLGTTVFVSDLMVFDKKQDYDQAVINPMTQNV